MKIFLIAGEESGDILGGNLMAALKEAHGDIVFAGIGSTHMQAQGMDSLFPMEELSVMGLAEIVPKIPHFLKRIDETVQRIKEFRPDVIITIDSPDFCFRVTRRVREESDVQAYMAHYVAPTVWAWRESRAKKVAGIYDAMLCLYPFEPPYFEKEGMDAKFIGHPVVDKIARADGLHFQKAHHMASEDSIKLGVLFGSRNGELDKMGAVYVETLQKLKKSVPNLHLIIPTLPHLERRARELAEQTGCLYTVTVSPNEKYDAFSACNAALATSGTAGLELAVAGVPHVIGYKTNAMTAAIVRRMVKVKYAHLANIILDKPVIPEFLQGDCTPDALAAALQELSQEEEARAKQKNNLAALPDYLRAEGDVPPSKAAAEFILQNYNTNQR